MMLCAPSSESFLIYSKLENYILLFITSRINIMTCIYLARHAEAAHPSEDPYQALNERGKKNAKNLAHFLKKAGITVERVYHSSKLRSKETAEILDSVLSQTHQLQYMPQLDPDRSIEPLCEKIAELPDKTLLVGHLPNLELLSNYLINGNFSTTPISFSPATIACFQQNGHAWLLQWLVLPALLPTI